MSTSCGWGKAPGFATSCSRAYSPTHPLPSLNEYGSPIWNRGLYILWPLDFCLDLSSYGEVCPECARIIPDLHKLDFKSKLHSIIMTLRLAVLGNDNRTQSYFSLDHLRRRYIHRVRLKSTELINKRNMEYSFTHRASIFRNESVSGVVSAANEEITESGRQSQPCGHTTSSTCGHCEILNKIKIARPRPPQASVSQ